MGNSSTNNKELTKRLRKRGIANDWHNFIFSKRIQRKAGKKNEKKDSLVRY